MKISDKLNQRLLYNCCNATELTRTGDKKLEVTNYCTVVGVCKYNTYNSSICMIADNDMLKLKTEVFECIIAFKHY